MQETTATSVDPLVERVIGIISRGQEVPAETMTLDSTFEELGFDSLDGINIAFDLEEEFDITIPDEAIRSVKDIRDVVESIRPLLERAAPG